jgi:RNA polymerase sigma-70 factor, ECF subfamily
MPPNPLHTGPNFGPENTSQSLLERLRKHPDSVEELDSLYGALLRRWVTRWGFQNADAEEVVQDAFLKILEKVPAFQHNGRPGAFRCWIRTILANCVRDALRRRKRRRWISFWSGDPARSLTDELEDSNSPLSKLWDEEHDRYLIQKVWEALAAEENTEHVAVFSALVMKQTSVQEVVDQFGITRDAVWQIKHRILKTLRNRLKDMVELD